MRCATCKGNIASGPQAQKMIVQYRQDDDSLRFFGFGMEDGPLAKATGRLTRAWHHKCFHVVRKREAKGDAVSGRILTGLLPDGSSEEVSIEDIRARMDELLVIAREVGKPIGDPTVHEAYLARQRGGPYAHHHEMPLDRYQLQSHLGYAHGVHFADHMPPDLRRAHDDLHRDQLFPEERDWREQVVLDIEKLQ